MQFQLINLLLIQTDTIEILFRNGQKSSSPFFGITRPSARAQAKIWLEFHQTQLLDILCRKKGFNFAMPYEAEIKAKQNSQSGYSLYLCYTFNHLP